MTPIFWDYATIFSLIVSFNYNQIMYVRHHKDENKTLDAVFTFSFMAGTISALVLFVLSFKHLLIGESFGLLFSAAVISYMGTMFGEELIGKIGLIGWPLCMYWLYMIQS